MNSDDLLSSIKLNSAERMAALRRQVSQVDTSTKDQDTGFLIELVPSLFGVFGIGYLYSGLTAAGIARIAVSIATWILYGIISTVTLGCGAITFPLFWLAIVGMAYFSAKELKELLPPKSAISAGQAQPPSAYLEPGRHEAPVAPYEPTPPYQQPSTSQESSNNNPYNHQP